MTLRETLQYSNFTSEDKEKFQKIKKILCKINTDFHNAEPYIGSLKIGGYDFQWKRDEDSSDPISRKEYINSHPEIQNTLDFSFSLSADDIIAQKIPMQVMGCTGVAKLFAKYAQEEKLDCFAVYSAKIEDLEKKKKGEKDVVSGHQIIAVQFSDGVRLFDPGIPDGLKFYKDSNGQEILVHSMGGLLGKKLVSQNSKDPRAQRQAGAVITSVEPSSKLEHIKSYKDLEDRYLVDDPEKIQKIKKIIYTIQTVFHNAEPTIGTLRQTSDAYDFQWVKGSSEPKKRDQYTKENKIKDELNFYFSLSAEDIIAQGIPMRVMGCTGVAKLFAKYAKEEGLDCFAVYTAKIDDLKKKKKDRNAIVSGHQIIAVQFSDGVRLFDPGIPDGLEFYKDNEGKEIVVNPPRMLLGKELVKQKSEDPWADRQAGTVIRCIKPAQDIENVKSYKDVEDCYFELERKLTQQVRGIPKE